MARDYAKKDRPAGKGAASSRKPAPKPRKASPAKRSAPLHSQHGALSFKWILSLAAAGGFVGFIVYLNTLPTGQESARPSEPAQQSAQPKTPAPGPPSRRQARPGSRIFGSKIR